MSDIVYVGLAGTPCGGTRILAEHLNGLVDRGHNCTLALLQGPVIDWMPTKFGQAVVKSRVLDRFDVAVATEINTWPVVADYAMFPNAQRRKVFIQMVEHMFFSQDNDAWAEFQKYYHHLCTLEPIVISKWLQRWARRQCGNTPPIVMNGVNTDMFYPDPIVDRDRLRILIEGHGKNMAKDIENMSHKAAVWLRDEGVDFELWGFSQYAQPYEYDHYWRLPSQSLIRQIYSSCDILLKASRFEGRSCIDPEAMACGCAVNRAIIEGDDDLRHNYNCLATRYSNQDAFQSNLMQLVKDKGLRDRLVTGGLDYVNRHLKWDRIIPVLEEALLS
jgi:glycosyltransferase involved in cell wall biosynthesis